MGENIWRPSPGREGLFYEVWKLKWSDAFGSAYQCAKNAAGFRKKFWTLKGAQAYADKLNGATHEH